MTTLMRGPQVKPLRLARRKPYLGESAGERRVIEYLLTRRAELAKKLSRGASR